MYAYSLLVQTPGSPNHNEWEPVRPGPDMEIPTVEALANQIKHDLGFLPNWMQGMPGDEYIQLEEEYKVGETLFLVDVEGSEDHVLPPVVWSIAYQRNPDAMFKRVGSRMEPR